MFFLNIENKNIGTCINIFDKKVKVVFVGHKNLYSTSKCSNSFFMYQKVTNL